MFVDRLLIFHTDWKYDLFYFPVIYIPSVLGRNESKNIKYRGKNKIQKVKL